MAATSAEVVVAVKDAEINMLRQQLAQISSDLSRNLAVMAVKEAEVDDASNAVTSLTAVLAEKDALFALYEEQVAALDALRRKEAAECKTLQAALDSQREQLQQQVQAEKTKREALEQQLERLQEDSTAQLQSARQAAVTQAVQHSNQYQADLERAADQRQQLQLQVQELQAVLASKESELSTVQMQLAAAVESTKRVQENHGKSMASKSALVTQMELELQQIKAAHSQANRAHEGHIAQLIASINELQELCTKQAAELQQYSAGQKAVQEEMRGLQKVAHTHEEARIKAEMRRSAMESALQHEVTAHAAVKAHQGLLQDCLVKLVTDLQQQHEGAAASVSQLSAQLSEAQEQMVCAAVSSQQASPHKAQKARALEDQYQGLSTQLLAAQERESCLRAICNQLHNQVVSMLPPSSPSKQSLLAAASPAKAPAVTSPVQHLSCLDALAHSLQQQHQQQQVPQQMQQQTQPQQQHGTEQRQHAAAYQPQQAQAVLQPQYEVPAAAAYGQATVQACQPVQQTCQGYNGNGSQDCYHSAPANVTPGQQALAGGCGVSCAPQHNVLGSGSISGYAESAAGAISPAGTSAPMQHTFSTPSKQAHAQQEPQQQHWQSLASPGRYSPSVYPHPMQAHGASAAPAAAAPAPVLPGSAAGMVSQLQEGVARLQQQLCANQQQMLQRMQPPGSPGSTYMKRRVVNSTAAHSTCSFSASGPASQPGMLASQQQLNQQARSNAAVPAARLAAAAAAAIHVAPNPAKRSCCRRAVR